MALKNLLISNKIWLSLFLIILFSFGVKFYNLEFPQSYYFDEVYFAFTAQEMAKGNQYGWQIPTSEVKAPPDMAYEWTHPPLGKEISAIGIVLFGDNTFGWRISQAFFGTLGTLLIFLLARNIFDDRVGLIAALLYSLESFIFVLSRITMVDIFIANFVLLASLFVVKFARSRKTIYLLLTGAFCGATMSVKWSGVYVTEFLAGVSFFLLYYFEVYSTNSQGSSYVKSLLNLFPRMIVAFGVVPLLVYMATYIPFFYFGNSISDFVNLQSSMFGYHGGVTDNHPYFSQWWTWPLMLKPVYFHFEDLGGMHSHIYAMGNPFIWWTGCAFVIIGVIQAVRKESLGLIFVLASFFAFWLPWALSPRKITFLYHFLPSLLFLLIISSYFLNIVWNRSKLGKIAVAVYILIAAGTFYYFYPVVSGAPLAPGAVDSYLWFSSWR
ncbi:MAG: phospholipid carrier-dependent glycosyltransferase [Thermodesulfobacteriota bacterium]